MQANSNDQFPMLTGDITKIHPLLMEGYFSLLRFFIYELLVSTGTIQDFLLLLLDGSRFKVRFGFASIFQDLLCIIYTKSFTYFGLIISCLIES